MYYRLFLRLVVAVSDLTVKCQQIESADTNKGIDNSGDPAHIAEKERNQVKAQESHQSPVDGADDDKGKCRKIQCFHIHKPPVPLRVLPVFHYSILSHRLENMHALSHFFNISAITSCVLLYKMVEY